MAASGAKMRSPSATIRAATGARPSSCSATSCSRRFSSPRRVRTSMSSTSMTEISTCWARACISSTRAARGRAPWPRRRSACCRSPRAPAARLGRGSSATHASTIGPRIGPRPALSKPISSSAAAAAREAWPGPRFLGRVYVGLVIRSAGRAGPERPWFYRSGSAGRTAFSRGPRLRGGREIGRRLRRPLLRGPPQRPRLRAVGSQPAVQRAPAYPQQSRGVFLIAVHCGQGHQDHLAVDGRQRGAQWNRVSRGGGFGRTAVRSARAKGALDP